MEASLNLDLCGTPNGEPRAPIAREDQPFWWTIVNQVVSFDLTKATRRHGVSTAGC
jgi:hypothetical protein